jgi:hypothetical protein
MRFLLLCVLLGVSVTSQLHARQVNDSALYNPGLQLLENAVTTENCLEAAFYFEQVARQYPGQWLLFYYTGLSYIQASLHALASNVKDDLISKAQPYIDKAFQLRPAETEIYILQAFLYQSRLMVNRETRSVSYAQKADASLKKALASDPSNPRIYFLMGCNVFYTPEMAGGGPGKALPIFTKAKTKFAGFTAPSPYMPHWGEIENQKMISACQLKK